MSGCRRRGSGRSSPAIRVMIAAAACAALTCTSSTARAQGLTIRYGSPVSSEIRTVYDAGLKYLAECQLENGTWRGGPYGSGPGVDGLCLMAMLSCGEDPNFGKYAKQVHAAVRAIIRNQSAETGFIAQNTNAHGSMYHHGFATLALAEAYGAVDDLMLWEGQQDEGKRTIGEALQLAVRALVESQKQNPHNAWRYTPKAKDADTSVSGACLMALLAARNAGVEVPDESIEKALKFFELSTLHDGTVAYAAANLGGGDDSLPRSAISCLVFAVAKKKDAAPHKATIKNLSTRIDEQPANWKYYCRYYMAQALFQGDFDSWEKWNRMNTEVLQEEQAENGSFNDDPYATAMNLLSMALNYRFLPIYER